MKIIEGMIKEIILEEDDVLIISSMKKNKMKLKISFTNGAIQIDDVPIEKIEVIKEEEKAIRAMKNYQSKKEK